MDLHDDALLAALRRIAGVVDGVPPTVEEAARAAFLTRDLDAEIAALIADSRATGEMAYEATRADDEAQGSWLLSFAGGGVRIDLEIDDDDGPEIRLLGQLTGAEVEECEVQADGRSFAAEADELGRFIVTGLMHGPIRLCCRLVGGRRVTTTWVRV